MAIELLDTWETWLVNLGGIESRSGFLITCCLEELVWGLVARCSSIELFHDADLLIGEVSFADSGNLRANKRDGIHVLMG